MSFPIPTLSPSGTKALDTLVHRVVTQENTLPVCFMAAANVNEIIYENQVGKKRYADESSGDVDAKTTIQLFSQTKFVTCLAAIQLIEQGKLALDDPDIISRYLPELNDLKILKGYKDADKPKEQQTKGQEIWEDPKGRITLRMLMTHTAGMSYPLLHPHLIRYTLEHPTSPPTILGPHATEKEALFPLVYEPGTSWNYSFSVDWVGFLVARVSGMTLDAYFQKNIFGPLGLKDLTFYPTKEIKDRLASWCTRDKTKTKFIRMPGLPFGRTDDPEAVGAMAGGAGLFGTSHDYLLFLQAILACSPNNPNPPAHRLISKESYRLLFAPCLPIKPEQRFPVDSAKGLGEIVNFMESAKPRASVDNINHSIAWSLSMSNWETGRKAGTGTWFGMLKTEFWVDPTTGVVAVCGTQILVENPDPWNDVSQELERTLYDGLEVANCGCNQGCFQAFLDCYNPFLRLSYSSTTH